MIGKGEILKRAAELEMDPSIISRDYILSWILKWLSQQEFGEKFIFKGGTALKKIYFPNFRFSVDLDFTVVGMKLRPQLLEELFNPLCVAPFEIVSRMSKRCEYRGYK